MKLDLFWTSIIVGSIVLAFILPKLFRKSESTTRKIGISVASFWILWTVFGVSQFFVGYAISGPLVIVQTLIILIVFYFSYTRFSEKQKHRKKIKELEKDIQRIDNERLKNLSDKEKAELKSLKGPKAHRQKLLQALREANFSLVILSGWLTDYAVDEEFRKLLKEAISRGVLVYIGYGYKSSQEKKESKETEIKAKETLNELQAWSASEETEGRLTVKYYPEHSKILICDNKFAIIGSFNWLSNKGGSWNDERSWISNDKEFIRSEAIDIILELENEKKNSKRRDFLNRFYKWTDYP